MWGDIAHWLGDIRGCSSSGTDFPGATQQVANSAYYEASVPIQTFRSLTPAMTGFLFNWASGIHGAQPPTGTYSIQYFV